MKRSLPLIAAAAICLVISSCASRWAIKASYDRSKDGEKGPSGETARYNPGGNAVAEALDELMGGLLLYDDDADHPDLADPWNPELYLPANKSADGLGLATNAGYVEKGRRIGDATEHLSYLEASEAFVYLHRTGGGILYGGLGPYIAYGIAGKVDFAGGSESVFTSDGYKRFDAGIHFLGEYRFRFGLLCGIGFDLGIFDKSTDPSDYTSRNRTMSVEAGYSIDKIVHAFKRK